MTEHSTGPLCHIAEVMIFAMMGVSAFVLNAIVGLMPSDSADLYKWTFTPLIGSLFGGLIAYAFNPRNESRRIIGGRAGVCIATGVIFTRVAVYFHPWIKELFNDPIILMGAGLGHGSLGFILSFWFVRGAYARAPRVAEEQLDEIEKKLTMKKPEGRDK